MFGEGKFWVRKNIFRQNIAFHDISYEKMQREEIIFEVSKELVHVKTPRGKCDVPMRRTSELRIAVLSWTGFSDARIHSIRII